MILILSVIFIIIGFFFDFPYSKGILFIGLLGIIYDLIANENEYIKVRNDIYRWLAKKF